MKVREIMKRPVISVYPETSVKEVFNLMVKHGISSIPVTDRDGNLVGLIPESNLLVRGKAHRGILGLATMHVHFDHQGFVAEQKKLYGKTAKDVMNTSVLTANENADILDVVDMMLEKNLSRFPVVRRGKLVGYISRTDIIKTVMEMEEEAESIEISDEEITRRVMEAFKTNMRMQLINVRVKTSNSVVTLSGQVGTAGDLRAAQEIAEAVPGVKAVENHLLIEHLLD